MVFLSALRRRPDAAIDRRRFPWSLPLVRDLETLEFTTPVTFLVGENGSGKSTLLEGIAAGMDAVAAGARDLKRDPTLQAARRSCRRLRVRAPPPCAHAAVPARRGRVRLHWPADRRHGGTRRDRAGPGASCPRDPAATARWASPAASEAALAQRYGADPDARSHGETFLALLQTRLVPNGLYFLDEPETPLSPTRVLALIALLADRVRQGCQFVIATHSPILMALPDATILLAEDGRLRPVAWNDLEHVRVTRAFLNDPAATLRRLLAD